jgi:hypothetical protein
MKQQPFDIFIPVAAKDIVKLPFVLNGVAKHIVGWDDIHVVVQDPTMVGESTDCLDSLSLGTRCHVHEERDAFDFDKSLLRHRPGWQYQMYLKLFQGVTQCSWYLTIDCDLVVLRDLPMYTNDKPIYWLFFATNNLRGLEEMKRAMWRVDEAGTFRFSDRSDPSQLKLLRLFSDDWLASSLLERLAGRTLTNGEIKEFVLTETPCHKHANALQGLYKRDKIEVLNIRSGAKRPKLRTDMDLLVRFPSHEI